METTLIQQTRLCRLVFACILGSLLYALFSHTLLHQLQGPVLKYPYADPSYWVLVLTGIPSFLAGHYGAALAFDVCLLGSCVLVLVFPERRWLVVVFFVLYSVYFFTYNIYGNWHTGSKAGVLVAPVPFMTRDKRRFGMLWEGLRYFTLFIYTDAFLWKLFRVSWLHADQGVLIVRENLAAYLYHHPSTLQARCYYWFLAHPQLVNWLFRLGWIAEGIFIVGFFTRKYDKLLLVLSLLLPFGFFFFADAFFFELYVLCLTLVDWKPRHSDRSPIAAVL